MNNKKRKIRVLFLAFVFLFLAQPAFAENKPIFKYGKQYELCQEIYEILQLPENEDYMKWPATKGYEAPRFKQELFLIPDSYKKFRLVEWKDVTEKEFQEKLPKEHQKLMQYVERGAPGSPDGVYFKGVKKATIDIFHRGRRNEVFKVDLGAYSRSFMKDDEDIGLRRFFNDADSTRKCNGWVDT